MPSPDPLGSRTPGTRFWGARSGWPIPFLLSALFAACSASITAPPLTPVPSFNGPQGDNLLPAIVDQLTDSDPEQRGALEKALLETFNQSDAFRFVSLLPQEGPAIHLDLRFIRKDTDQALQNSVNTGVSALGIFLLNPALPLHYPKAAAASLTIRWPDGARTEHDVTCEAEGTATLDKVHGVEVQAAAQMERQCMRKLLDATLKDLPAHIPARATNLALPPKTSPALQRTFRAPLDASQRKAAAAGLCDVLGISPEGPERRRCLMEMDEVVENSPAPESARESPRP